jgi:hypothetical protein
MHSRGSELEKVQCREERERDFGKFPPCRRSRSIPGQPLSNGLLSRLRHTTTLFRHRLTQQRFVSSCRRAATRSRSRCRTGQFVALFGRFTSILTYIANFSNVVNDPVQVLKALKTLGANAGLAGASASDAAQVNLLSLFCALLFREIDMRCSRWTNISP